MEKRSCELTRRCTLTTVAASLISLPAWAQGTATGDAPVFSTLAGKTPSALTDDQLAQRQMISTAPPGQPGRWEPRAALPAPRSEMAWACSLNNRMHLIGGYGQARVDRPWHQVYRPAADRWMNAAPLPRGANHVAVAALGGRVYALGGFLEQNRTPDDNAFVYDPGEDRWQAIRRLPRERGAAAAVVLNDRIHLIGGASSPSVERASVGWHEVYDPTLDSWETRKPLPGARDHVGAVAWQGRIHVIGGRFNTFEYNTGLHHIYLPDKDRWEVAAPMPTPRSGHGLVVLRDRFFAMGGEERLYDKSGNPQDRVFGQMESYDPVTNSWQSHAPMLTPRHGLGATLLGDWIHVAGGGPVLGGSTQSAIHEAFTLG